MTINLHTFPCSIECFKNSGIRREESTVGVESGPSFTLASTALSSHASIYCIDYEPNSFPTSYSGSKILHFFFLQMERVANVIGPRSPVTDASFSRQIS